MLHSTLCPYGEVEALIEYDDGRTERHVRRCDLNIVLNNGKAAQARSLAGDIGSAFTNYVCKMLFGTNGTVGGVPRFVDAGRSGLFGPTLIAKNVTSIINPSAPNTVIFTTVLTFSDANGSSINEMALQMANGDLYSMVTFGDVTKTSSMQITYSWSLSLL